MAKQGNIQVRMVVYAGRYSAFPGICRLKGRELLVVFREGKAHVDPTGQILLVRSTDGGETWSDSSLVFNGPLDDRNAAVTQISDGTVLLSFDQYNVETSTTEGVYLLRSPDKGQTWLDPPIRIPSGFSEARARAEVLELPSGDLLFPLYGRDDGSDVWSSSVIRSSDGGGTWSEEAIIARDPDGHRSYEEPSLTLVDDPIICVMRTNEDYLYQSASTDGGRSWSQAQNTQIHSGRSPGHLLRLSSGTLVCSYGYRVPPYGIRAVISWDGGATWEVEEETYILLEGQPGLDLGYASSVQLDDGSILCVFYYYAPGDESRRFIGGVKFRV